MNKIKIKSPNIKLLYLWIEDYKNIKKQGFNFSEKYEFEFQEESKKLKIIDKNHIKNFLSDNIGITAIVGKNGSGKTSLIKLILDSIAMGILIGKLIYMYESNGNIGLFSNIIDTNNINDNTKEKLFKKDIKFSENNNNYIVYSNYLEVFNLYKEGGNNVNDTIKNITITNEIAKTENNKQLFKNLYFKDVKKQIKFLSNNSLIDVLKNNLDFFHFPEFALLNINYSIKDKLIGVINDKIEQYENEIKVYKAKDKHNYIKEKERYLNELLDCVVKLDDSHLLIDNRRYDFELYQLEKDYSNNKNEDLNKKIIEVKRKKIKNKTELESKSDESFIKLKNKYYEVNNEISKLRVELDKIKSEEEEYNVKEKEKLILDNIKNYIEKISLASKSNIIANIEKYFIVSEILNYIIGDNSLIELNKNLINNDLDSILSFFETFENSKKRFESFEKLILEIKKSINKNDEENDYIKFKIENIEELHKLMRLYYNSIYDIGYLTFEWGYMLSAGEENILNFLARIYDTFSNIDKNKNTMLLIDEGEISFHPNWQKRFVNIIIEFIKALSIEFDYKNSIQIILTTHSPFIISDLPKNNVIFLDTNSDGTCKVISGTDKKDTFGANIHTLLSDSFFMDGTMGEFAKKKINEVIDLLNNDNLDEKEIKYCEQVISILGEPIIKRELQRMLDSKRLKKVDEIDDIKKNIEDLQKRLEELENDKDL